MKTVVKTELLALVSDLRRVCLGIQRESKTMSARFAQEAQRDLANIPKGQLKPYIQDILQKLEVSVLAKPNSEEKAEECLTYSVILRNYALQF